MTTSLPPPDAKISKADVLSYWNHVAPTVNGMLGGFPQVSRIDLRGSSNFLAKLCKQHAQSTSTADKIPLLRGVDCGAGIGRVTAGFLSKVCEVVDVVEPVEKFAKEVKGMGMTGSGRVDQIYVMGLEEWFPTMEYDLIWNQWCLGYLTDEQLVNYLKRCRAVLKKHGWIVVKENVVKEHISTKLGGDVFDNIDVIRTDGKFRRLFEESGLIIVRTELQSGFPKGLYPVRFYALQPKSWEGKGSS